jgi:hypothetical protein
MLNNKHQMLRPEVERHVSLWTYVGAGAGAVLGFIIANLPGLMVGAYGGKRLGAIRDAKGKSVASVFTQLGAGQKAEVSVLLFRKLSSKALFNTDPKGVGHEDSWLGNGSIGR